MNYCTTAKAQADAHHRHKDASDRMQVSRADESGLSINKTLPCLRLAKPEISTGSRHLQTETKSEPW